MAASEDWGIGKVQYLWRESSGNTTSFMDSYYLRISLV
jgi:hypothetical protein